MEVEEQEDYPYENNVDVGDMPSQIQCFLVLPFEYSQANKPDNFKVKPYVITYHDEDTTMGEMMNEYRKNADCMLLHRINFTLRMGKILDDENMSIYTLKSLLGRESLNRIVLFTQINYKIKLTKVFYERPLQIYEDQCAVSQYLEKQKEFGSENITIIVQMPRKYQQKEIMTIHTPQNLKIRDLSKTIIYELQKNYKENLKEDQIDLFITETNKTLLPIYQMIRQKIFNWSRLTVRFKRPVQLRRVSNFNCNHSILIYRENNNQNPVKLEFAKIADMTFKELYESKLVLQESKNRKLLAYGLKIMDMIVGPQQKLMKAAPYFSFQAQNPYMIVAKVINQKMVFYHLLPQLQKDLKQFHIDNFITIPQHQSSNRQDIRKRTLQRIKVIQNEYFKKVEILEPILIYTSDLCYCEDIKTDPNQGSKVAKVTKVAKVSRFTKVAKVYESLNRFLRDTPVLSLDYKTFSSEWRYKYAFILLKHLRNAQKFTGNVAVYRGVGFNPLYKQGEIISFKQFTSTTTNKDVAIEFAMDSSNKIKYMMKIYGAQGYNIREFSKYMKEDQILIEPFSQFEVLSVSSNHVQKVYNKVTKKYDTVPFILYELRQVIRHQQLPKIKANFIVWIDQNPQEAINVFNQLNIPRQTTIFNILTSTIQLRQWLARHQSLKDEPTANFIFITNMTRKEGNKWNEIAGIQALREIRRFKGDINVFFYVGDVNKANQKLIDNHVYDENISVASSPQQIVNYFSWIINAEI